MLVTQKAIIFAASYWNFVYLQHSKAILFFYKHLWLTARYTQRIRRITCPQKAGICLWNSEIPTSFIARGIRMSRRRTKGAQNLPGVLFPAPSLYPCECFLGGGGQLKGTTDPSLSGLFLLCTCHTFLPERFERKKAGNLPFPVRPFKKKRSIKTEGGEGAVTKNYFS